MVLLWLYYLSDKSSFEYYLTYAVTVKLIYALTIRTPLTNLWKCLSTCRQIHCSTFSYSWNAIFCSGCKWEGNERNGPLDVCHLVDLEWDLCGHLLVFYHVCTLRCLPIPPSPVPPWSLNMQHESTTNRVYGIRTGPRGLLLHHRTI